MKFYLLYKNNGLYDPVLDDSEPIYEYPPDDLDPQLEPTEVPFKIQQFIEPPDLTNTILDTPIPDYTPGFSPVNGSRSLTASPFVGSTKPYRPFSTEPIPDVVIPPLEDPIILNPNYRDQFGKSPADVDPDYLLNAHNKNGLDGVGTRFKLPISEQYDPDGTKQVKNVEIQEKLFKYERHVKSLSRDLEVVDKFVRTVEVDETETKNAISSLVSDSKEFLTTSVKVSESSKEDIKVDSKIDTSIEEIVKHESTTKKDILETKETIRKDYEEQSIKEELKYLEKMKQEIDIERIEETAVSVVEESIERAVSVAEEIKKEIEEELVSSATEHKEEIVSESSIQSKMTEKSTIDELSLMHKDKKQSTKVAQEESYSSTSHKERSEAIDLQEITSSKCVIEGSDVSENVEYLSHKYEEIELVEKPVTKESIQNESKSFETKASKTVANGSIKTGLSTDQRTEKHTVIGLKSIPNIRGVVHSSYHYNLLLQTFFIHLTDVMVALSRFLLSQPVFNETLKSQETVTKTDTYKSGKEVRTSEQDTREERKMTAEKKVEATEAKRIVKQEVIKPVVQEKKEVKAVAQKIEDKKVETVQSKKVETKEIIKPVPMKAIQQEVNVKSEEKVEKKQETKLEKIEVKDAAIEITEKTETKDAAVAITEKKVVTGAEMAQRTEKKLTKDLTKKMDAVISEFQTVAVEDDKKEMMQRNRRSRSRSQVEEEVMRESDPLEWLDKVEKKSVRKVTEMSSKESKEFSSSETLQKSHVETKHETKHKTSKPPKQMYLAIVESHVYTNKDAIFEEEVTEFSETSSVQSAEEVNTAFEAIETMSTENVALESAIKEIETAKLEIEESREFSTATSKSEAIMQKVEETVQDTKEIVEENYKKETAIQSSTDIKEVIIQETKEIIEPVIDIKEETKKEKVAIDVSESLSVAESTEVSILESKQELTSIEKKEESVAIVKEDTVVESKTAVLEVKPPEEVNVSAVIKVKTDKPVKTFKEAYAELEIVKEYEVGMESKGEMIDIEEVSEKALSSEAVINKLEMSTQIEIDKSKHAEKSFASSQIGLSQSSIKTAVDISQSTVSKSSEIQMASTKGISEHIKLETISQATSQESSVAAKSKSKKLTLKTDLGQQISGPPSTIDTPTPSTVPPTPLTDEYVFQLEMPLPKSRSTTPVPRDCSLTPEDEDPHIVKKKLIPHIDIDITSRIFDPPLPTPPEDKVQSPVYTKPGLSGGADSQKYPNFLTRLGKKALPVYRKPGLFGGADDDVFMQYYKPLPVRKPMPVYVKPGLYGGADKPDLSEEEIREIERKSSLLASAIDETIKSIEEYKEEVGIETKKEVKTFSEVKSHKELTVKSIKNGVESVETKIQETYESSNGAQDDNNNTTTIEEIEVKENEIQLEEIGQQNVVTEELEETKASEHSSVSEVKCETKEDSTVVGLETEHIDTEIQTEFTISEETTKHDDSSKTEVQEATVEITREENERTSHEEETRKKVGFTEVDIVILAKTEESNGISEKIESQTEEVKIEKVAEKTEEKSDTLKGFRPVVFDPEAIQKRSAFPLFQEPTGIQEPRQSPYLTASGEIIGTMQGIVDGLEDPVMDAEVAKELGKPGMTETKIAELISGEAEMLREAHVMGLTRVLTSHMHRPDDSSVDFQKIKPLINSLKDSEVLKALNEELARQRAEQKKKEEEKKHWTTFLQKPKRPVPTAKFGYHGWTGSEEAVTEPYKVSIVKQPKPKVAPDYKPEDFDTGPLPWEQRGLEDSNQPPVEPEEPILIPELPVYLEAVDPLKESEVPDLEDTGIPLPPPKEPTPPPEEVIQNGLPEEQPVIESEEVTVEAEVKEVQEDKQESRQDMENRLADQLVKSVQSMVDPNASVDQQLSQMRAQLAALAQLPEVIQQSLELVSRQLNQMGQKGTNLEVSASHAESHSCQHTEVSQNHESVEMQATTETQISEETQKADTPDSGHVTIGELDEHQRQSITEQTMMQETNMQETAMQEKVMQEQKMRTEILKTPEMIEEEKRIEKQKKEQRQESESRQLKQRGTPRSTKPKKVFGPLDPEERMAVVLPGGRRWKGPQDVYDEQQFAETMQAQAELIQGKALGVNFMKYEKPPVSLEHLKHSEVYKLVHDMDQPPLKRVEMRTPAVAEADYRERCRSSTPSAMSKHVNIPQQFHP